ncbi:MAG TPA: tRNA (adenosine(37)-N6)-threonylcarbamoyltransferase complex dimerization subunit type 1 TsaB [Propionibacteriaceae bacterium]|nr:tRNA (adenosine(37)-N6)-threonylcarbamoyltransferase complex dimerization subunit type 1 TsaB [Propionibacteriaceae bacterium]
MSEWVLGIDTSTDVCIGLARDGEPVASRRVDDRRAHAEHLQALIDRACADEGIALTDVGRVVVGLGPGPFTGLRVGIVTARTIAALGGGFPGTIAVPKGVCSLDVVARQAVLGSEAPAGEFVVASDARRRELYWARYSPAGERIGEPQVGRPDTLPDLPVVGPGADLYADVLGPRVAPGPRALDAGVLAASIDVLPDAGIEPLYLRKPDATVPSTRKSTLVTPRLSRR